LGQYDQLSSILTSVEPNFPVSGDSGIPKSINDLFSAFSALGANPNDTTTRQQVINQASQVATEFNGTAAALGSVLSTARQQVSASVDTINHLAGLIRDFNVSQQTNAGAAGDASTDARLHATLEQLSEFAGIQALRQSDGSLTVLLNGETPLVVGGNQFQIQADTTSGPTVSIKDSNGGDITSEITTGRLGGGLRAVNQLLPAYRTGLDQLARGIADAVNGALAGGVDSNGVAGAPLFSYTAGNPAATLSVTGIAAAQLAAAAPSSPGGNGNALALSALGSNPGFNGLTFAGAFGNLAALVGRDVSNAADNRGVQQQLLAQARAQRAASSGVSLDEEAVRLVEFQRAYEATAKLVSVLDQLSATTIAMIP
jgi:flagellar hook-associated protein 1 FlgK